MGRTRKPRDLNLATRIREERELIGLSVATCATALGVDGVDRTLWWHWENGKRPIPADLVPSIARVLGVTLVRLYGLLPKELEQETATNAAA